MSLPVQCHGTMISAVRDSTLAANKYHLSLFNNAGSLPLEVWTVIVQPSTTAAAVGLLAAFFLMRTTANGTPTAAVTIRRTNTRGLPVPASVISSSAWSVNPTELTAPELASTTVNTEETAAQAETRPLWEANGCGIDPILLFPGQGLVVKQGGLASAGAVSAFIYFRIKRRLERNGGATGGILG